MFPLGAQTWQIKAGADPPSVADVLRPAGVRGDIEAGRGFVLVWSKDPPSRMDLEDLLKRQVAEINPDASAILIAADDLERLARVQPAVIQALGGPSMIGISGPATSMCKLSIPRPASADIKCSTVEIDAPSFLSVDDSRVSPTLSARAGIDTVCGKSMR